MRFRVRHVTAYRYAAPVGLAAHVLRLTPRPDAGKLIARTLTIEPEPVFREDAADPFGNLFTRAGFHGLTDRFSIDSRFELETPEPPPPPDVDPPPLPWSFSADDPVAAYLGEGGIDGGVRAFAAELAAECGGEALAFLQRLNATLFKTIRHDIRDEGAGRRPEETLALGHGACRDVTILFLAACRSLGAPARFVSGYQAKAETPDGRRHLHAWAEAFVPGAGWLAYDPTHGLFVTDGHVALSAAPSQAATMPVEGGFYAAGAVAAKLSYEVDIATG